MIEAEFGQDSVKEIVLRRNFILGSEICGEKSDADVNRCQAKHVILRGGIRAQWLYRRRILFCFIILVGMLCLAFAYQTLRVWVLNFGGQRHECSLGQQSRMRYDTNSQAVSH